MMAEATKTFALGDVLSITTGRLVSESHIGGVYQILNWMTRDNLFTHQLSRVRKECAPWLLRWFPELKNARVWLLDQMIKEGDDNTVVHDLIAGDVKAERMTACAEWVKIEIGAFELLREYEVPRIPIDDHERKHPYDELVVMRGTD